jgi:hypothetical protein
VPELIRKRAPIIFLDPGKKWRQGNGTIYRGG